MFPSHLSLEAMLSFPRFYLLWVPGELAGQKPPPAGEAFDLHFAKPTLGFNDDCLVARRLSLTGQPHEGGGFRPRC